jgi:hypothetical protein
MIQYIYFVKCPNCEDEPFDFFNDAKEFALGCLSSKPIITQVEVDRNDFGECVNSADLGTIWSWKDETNITEDEPAVSVFTRSDLAEYDPEHDAEFDALDNSLDEVPDNFCKPVPADMTIKDLVEAMEENEDTVECTWCEELFDKSECRYEVDLGYLCSRCEAAIKSRGETLTFRENDYWSFLDEGTESSTLEESVPVKDTVELDYDHLKITLQGPQRDVDDWDEVEYSGSYTYKVPKEDVVEAIWENFITEEDAKDVVGGLKTLEENDIAWTKFLKSHFDTLVDKYYEELLEYFKDDAIEAFENESDYTEIMDSQDYFEESAKVSCSKSMIEELEESDSYRERLDLCPECGDNSFYSETGFCINCGFSSF